MNEHLSKGDTQMANKHMKRVPEITNHQGTRFKPTKRGHVTPLGGYYHTHTHTDDNKCWRVWGNWSLVRCRWDARRAEAGDAITVVPQNRTELPSDPATPLWAQNQVRGRQELRYLHTCAHSSRTGQQPLAPPAHRSHL